MRMAGRREADPGGAGNLCVHPARRAAQHRQHQPETSASAHDRFPSGTRALFRGACEACCARSPRAERPCEPARPLRHHSAFLSDDARLGAPSGAPCQLAARSFPAGLARDWPRRVDCSPRERQGHALPPSRHSPSYRQCSPGMDHRTTPRAPRRPAPRGRALLAALALTAALAQAQADPVLETAGFDTFVADLWPAAEAQGVSRKTFEAATQGLHFDPKIAAHTQRQAEFLVPIWTYLAGAVIPARIVVGRKQYAALHDLLARAKRVYDVDPGAIMGAWGVETEF